MGKFIDLSGQQIGRLTVVARSENRSGKPAWECKCSCGSTCVARASDLRSGRHRSCGCLHIETITTHGHSGQHGNAATRTAAYQSWMSMKARCLNKNSAAYSSYGGSGVKIHPAWAESFSEFLRDVGEPPTRQYTLDRFPNNRGNYEPGNVRWATNRQQANNRTTNRIVSHGGEVMSVAELCRKLGLSEDLVRGRLKKGWSIEDAASLPLGSVLIHGAHPSRSIDITGLRFGKLIVLKRAGTTNKRAMWECHCDCGKVSIVTGKALRKGHTKSCGCNKGAPGVPKRRLR